jgi:hypothetical protein
VGVREEREGRRAESERCSQKMFLDARLPGPWSPPTQRALDSPHVPLSIQGSLHLAASLNNLRRSFLALSSYNYTVEMKKNGLAYIQYRRGSNGKSIAARVGVERRKLFLHEPKFIHLWELKPATT